MSVCLWGCDDVTATPSSFELSWKAKLEAILWIPCRWFFCAGRRLSLGWNWSLCLANPSVQSCLCAASTLELTLHTQTRWHGWHSSYQVHVSLSCRSLTLEFCPLQVGLESDSAFWAKSASCLHWRADSWYWLGLAPLRCGSILPCFHRTQ